MRDVATIGTIGGVLGAAMDAAYPATENCPHCKGSGVRAMPNTLVYLGICVDCKGTGKLEVPAEIRSEPSRPGLGDEIKPDLMTKKLRSW